MSNRSRVDTDLVHEIVIEEGRMSNPYAEFSTLVDKLNTLKPYLIRVARSGELTTYMETAENTGIFTARQAPVLGTLGLHEDEIGNPPLSAVVVQSRDSPMVGEKYFAMINEARNLTADIPSSTEGREEHWRKHLEAVRNH